MNKLLIIICFLILTTATFSNEIKQNYGKTLITQVNKVHAGGILLGTATTIFNACAVTDVILLTRAFSISSIILCGTLTGLSTAFLLGTLIPGGILLNSGLKKTKQCHSANEQSLRLLKNKLVKLKKTSIISAGFCISSALIASTGIALICADLALSSDVPFIGIIGDLTTVLGSCGVFVTLPILITSLAMSAWLKGQTNRLSVDIGVTSGNSGELSCDKKRNALEKPSGVKLAMSVKF